MDKNHKWVWCFLGAVLAWNVYFVQQMVALAFFTAAFCVLAMVIVSLYLVQNCLEGAAES